MLSGDVAMNEVLVLGGQGMLGSAVCEVLAESGWSVTATTRRQRPPARGAIRWTTFDAERDPLETLLDYIKATWLINCVGVIKPLIDEADSESVLRAIAVNAIFPRRLADAAVRRGRRVIEIATDGVFSGRDAPYDETAPHDPTDVYGKTKSLGERARENVISLRCSIVGRERRTSPLSLLDRTLAAAPRATLTGFVSQRWNGITTLHLARLCAAAIAGAPVAGSQHVVPADAMTKADLLSQMLRAFGRDDVTLDRVPGPAAADRTLVTAQPEINTALWRAAGYPEPPTIAQMLGELAEWSSSPHR